MNKKFYQEMINVILKKRGQRKQLLDDMVPDDKRVVQEFENIMQANEDRSIEMIKEWISQERIEEET